MSLIEKIEKIQKKPRKRRIMILWILTTTIMVIIVVVWLFSFSHNLKEQKASKNSENSGIPSLFQTLKKDFSSFKESMEAAVKNINSTENEK